VVGNCRRPEEADRLLPDDDELSFEAAAVDGAMLVSKTRARFRVTRVFCCYGRLIVVV
jgi:hypothetical protein